ncbi:MULTISPECIES: helix-turn-helix domain-containing protein [unclassified Roseovarius]|uniref:helix-turn-helix domain-containing protein n=1 Tax=unclassified Roseovarius TaxID=2614913 RepID=UPI00273FE1EF|nr:helix-turn-helix domain-containing protein [Roseovarius sp. MMSF_3350]
MIGFRSKRTTEEHEVEPRGFDAFELRLGDLMRGERATIGKSLLDVERELRIKASYIAAIENCDPDAFDTPGFIPGYVRSYARYLNMDPDRAFAGFCAESGFSIAHGMSAEASSIRRADAGPLRRQPRKEDPIALPKTPFVPATESFLARIEPGAVGSVMVLCLLIGGLGYGGWSVLKEVQRVQFAPVENTPAVLSDLDPLEGAVPASGADGATRENDPATTASVFNAPRDERLDRLYRPEALEVPVMIARDAPISTLNPAEMGAFSGDLPEADRTSPDYASATAGATQVAETEPAQSQQPRQSPQVLAEQPAGVKMVAVRPAWVRVQAPDGSVIYETIMNAGDTWDVPVMEGAPTIRIGESGAIYFAVNGVHHGPAGQRGQVTSGLPLDSQMLADALPVANLEADQDLSRYVAELEAGAEIPIQD